MFFVEHFIDLVVLDSVNCLISSFQLVPYLVWAASVDLCLMEGPPAQDKDRIEDFGARSMLFLEGISDYIPQFTVGCNFLSQLEIPASGAKALNYRLTMKTILIPAFQNI